MTPPGIITIIMYGIFFVLSFCGSWPSRNCTSREYTLYNANKDEQDDDEDDGGFFPTVLATSSSSLPTLTPTAPIVSPTLTVTAPTFSPTLTVTAPTVLPTLTVTAPTSVPTGGDGGLSPSDGVPGGLPSPNLRTLDSTPALSLNLSQR
jgi:hypothetical protein